MHTEDIGINALLFLQWRISQTPHLDTRAAIPVLLRVLNTDKSKVLRSMAPHCLRDLFSGSSRPSPELKKACVDVLVKTLRDSDPFVRDSTAFALKAIDPEAATRAGVR